MTDMLVRIRMDDGSEVVDVRQRSRRDMDLGYLLADALVAVGTVIPDVVLTDAVAALCEWDEGPMAKQWDDAGQEAVMAAQNAFLDAAMAYQAELIRYRRDGQLRREQAKVAP